jgi:hypothetical protein
MKRLSLLAVVLALAAALPAHALAATFKGVVVGRTGGTIAVATAKGTVHTIRAHARIGAVVRVTGARIRVVGRAHRAHVHGVVVRRVGRTTFLAAGRSLLAVRGGRALAAMSGSGPATGVIVNATVGISGNLLTNEGMAAAGKQATVTVLAPVTAVAPGSITVTVNGQPLTIALPAGITLPASLVGQSVTLTLSLVGAEPNAVRAEEDDDDDNAGPDNDDDNDDQGENEDEDDDHGGHGHGGDDGD